eukprot:5740872-Pleurochrysis_carterae.AAC.1
MAMLLLHCLHRDDDARKARTRAHDAHRATRAHTEPRGSHTEPRGSHAHTGTHARARTRSSTRMLAQSLAARSTNHFNSPK